MKKVLFLIHDLGPGGAEKVLVNLVNHLDREKFDITVMALFGGGVNEAFLKKDIRLINCHKKAFRGNSHLMKLLTPRQLYRRYVKERYDIVVSYLEGPSARIVSGCDDPNAKKVAWIHVQQGNPQCACQSFRSYGEALAAYGAFHRIICVSEAVREDFLQLLPVTVPTQVLYNTNETEQILHACRENVPQGLFKDGEIRLVGVGKLLKNKGFQRVIPMVKRLREEGFPAHLYLLGDGPMKEKLEELAAQNGVADAVHFLGYQVNPYAYIAKCDLFVCASYAEGFSTAATEALILGVPVCTVKVAGMQEMLGKHNQYGIVTENENEALYQGIKRLLGDPALLNHYREQAALRGKEFSTENTVRTVETMLEEVLS